MSMRMMLYALTPSQEALLRSNNEALEQLAFEERIEIGPKPPMYDIDKGWHGLHFLLTGTEWDGSYPLSFLCKGGEELGADMGYGPVRLVAQTDVKLLLNALRKRTAESIRAAFSISAFTKAEIYPHSWDQSESADELADWFRDLYSGLCSFVEKAASTNSSILVALT